MTRLSSVGYAKIRIPHPGQLGVDEMDVNKPCELFPCWSVTSANGKVLRSFATEAQARAWVLSARGGAQ